MKQDQEGNTLLIILAAVVLVLLGLWYLMQRGYKLPLPTVQGPAIQGVTELNAAGQDLDNTNLNQVDTGVNQLNSDTSTF